MYTNYIIPRGNFLIKYYNSKSSETNKKVHRGIHKRIAIIKIYYPGLLFLRYATC